MNHQEPKNIALGIAIAMLVFSLVLKQDILVVLAILLLVGLIFELKAVYMFAQVWHYFFSRIITYFSNTILTIIYILILTPYSWLYRLMNRKNVSIFLSGPSEKSSYYTLNKGFSSKDFEHPW